LSYIDSEIERLKMQLGTFHLSRDHVGRLLDMAMTNLVLNETPFEHGESLPQQSSGDASA